MIEGKIFKKSNKTIIRAPTIDDIDLAFTYLNLHRIMANYAPRNLRLKVTKL